MAEAELPDNKQQETIIMPQPLDPRNNMASGFIARMKELINDYAKELEEDEFIHVQVILNDGRCITAKNFGWYDPNIISVRGVDSHGNQIKAIIHHSNAQIVLIKVKKRSDEKKVDLEFQKGYQ
ncbi:MAG: hypothetical protein ACPK7O_08465 [Methanobacterium sp.]